MTNMAWAKACGVGALVAFIAAALATAAGLAPIGWAGGFLTALVLGLAAAWFRAQEAREAEQRRLLRDGASLARWRYSPEEWQRFASGESERIKRRARGLPVWVGLAAGCAGLSLGASWLAVAGLLALGAAAGLGLGHLMRTEASRTLNVDRPGAVISPEAALLNARVINWSGPGVKLEGVELVPGEPPVLKFEIGTQAGGARARRTRRLPVPAAHAAEVPRLRAALGFPRD